MELNKLVEIINSPSSKKIEENLELWQQFYKERHEIISNNILNPQLFQVIDFCLANDFDEVYPYFKDNLLKALHFYQSKLCFNIRNNNTFNQDKINSLFTNLKYHLKTALQLSHLDLEDNLGEIRRYQDDGLEVNTIDALIMVTYNDFFEMDSEVVKKVINYISASKILFKTDLIYKQIMYSDLIYQYIDKIIPLKIYLGYNIKEDKLIEKIKKQDIKNKRLINKLEKSLPLEHLLTIIDYDLEKLIIFLEKIDYMDEYEKQIIFNKVLDKILLSKEVTGTTSVIGLIANKNQSTLFKNYMTQEKLDIIHTKYISSILCQLTSNEEEINYILDNNLYDLEFLQNLNYLLQNENSLFCKDKNIEKLREKEKSILEDKFNITNKLKEQEINTTDSINLQNLKSGLYDLMGKIIPQETAILLLKEYLKNNIDLSQLTVKSIIRSIVINTLKEINVKVNAVCFDKDPSYNGINIDDYEVISININLVNNLLDKNKTLYDRLKIFYVMFHEMQHSKQNNDMKQENIDFNNYQMLKEEILINYNNKYYKDNYIKVLSEIDARVNGYEMFSKFLEIYYKDLLDQIQDSLLKDLETEKEYQEDSDEINQVEIFAKKEIHLLNAFDNLIKYHKNIIEDYPIFKLEYNQDGSVKTEEEILSQKTDETEEILKQLIEKRNKIDTLNIKNQSPKL